MKLAVHCADLTTSRWRTSAGRPEPMLEGYTSLAFLAGQTQHLELGPLVSGVTYRHPGLLAKIVTTLDVLDRHCADVGWDPAEIARTVITGADPLADPDAFLTAMQDYAALGIDQVWVGPQSDDPVGSVEQMCVQLLPRLRELSRGRVALPDDSSTLCRSYLAGRQHDGHEQDSHQPMTAALVRGEAPADERLARGLWTLYEVIHDVSYFAPQVSDAFLGAANAALPAPSVPYERLWQLCTTLREWRGDAYVAALVTHGLAGPDILVLRCRLDLERERMQQVRGWHDEDWTAATDRVTGRGLLTGDGLTAAGAGAAQRSRARH